MQKINQSAEQNKVAFVIQENIRAVSMITFKDRTIIELYEYEDGFLEKSVPYTWDESLEFAFIEFKSIQDIIKEFNATDIIFLSNLTFKGIFEIIKDEKYAKWESNWEVCLNMLKCYMESEKVNYVTLEYLEKLM